MRLGASAVAAPVFDHAKRVVAAITVVGPAERLREKRLLRLADLVVQAADSLGRDLGWSGDNASRHPRGRVAMPTSRDRDRRMRQVTA
jgi:hypothetical protein